MSLFDYAQALELTADDVSFAALIFAAMRRADTDNLAKLRAAWPEVWAELDARYQAPGGRLPDDGPVTT